VVDPDRETVSLYGTAQVRSLRDLAYEAIRDAILDGGLEPGERVKERDVAAQMNVSTTPVKEALRRLEQEGLVVAQPRRGAIVSSLARIPVHEIEEIRGLLESMAARLAGDRMTEEEIERLRGLVVEMTELTLEMREPQTRLADVSVFHQLIREGSRNDFIVRFVDSLTPFERVHRPEYLDPDEARRILGEHEAICEALAARDGLEAERLMAEHFRINRAAWREAESAQA
jgi:DNA-binding GntR family transcriptional regulator